MKALKPLSPMGLALAPVTRLIARDKGPIDRRVAYTRHLIATKKAQKEEAKILAKEAKIFGALLISTWARLGEMYAARWRYDTGPDAGSRKKRKRTQYVQFERVFTQSERIYYKILVRKRGLFGWKDKLPHRVRVIDLINDETLKELSYSVQRSITAFSEARYGAWVIINRLEGNDGLPREVSYSNILPYLPENAGQLGIVGIGIGEHRKVQLANLSKQPHWLIGGASGGGKSNTINVIISTFMRFAHPDELKLVLIDLKRVEFSLYRGAPHLFCDPIFEAESALEMLDSLVNVIHDRANLMMNKAKEISDWNNRNPDQKMARIVCVIDEFAELTVAVGKKVSDQVRQRVQRISALGRAVGVHLIIATQRPAVQVVDNAVKINMELVICARTQNKAQSMTILGLGDAADLPLLPGRMLTLTGSVLRPIQVPRITEDDIYESIAIARGRAAGLLTLDGYDQVISMPGLTDAIYNDHGGMLGLDSLAVAFRGLGISKTMLKDYLKWLIKAGSITTAQGDYQVTKRGNSYQLVRTNEPEAQAIEPEPEAQPVEVIEPIIDPNGGLDPKIISALEKLSEIRANRAKGANDESRNTVASIAL